jgi:hypothetical protein
MKRLLLLLALTVTLVTGLLAATQTAASAYNWSENREATSCHYTVCLDVWYKRDQDNTGFYQGMTTVSGCDGSCSSVNGYTLKCMNQNGTVLWSKPGDQINLGHADVKSWTPNNVYAGATELKCVFTGQTSEYGSLAHNDVTDIIDRT